MTIFGGSIGQQRVQASREKRADRADARVEGRTNCARHIVVHRSRPPAHIQGRPSPPIEARGRVELCCRSPGLTRGREHLHSGKRRVQRLRGTPPSAATQRPLLKEMGGPTLALQCRAAGPFLRNCRRKNCPPRMSPRRMSPPQMSPQRKCRLIGDVASPGCRLNGIVANGSGRLKGVSPLSLWIEG
jgi:hypothetical protein